MHKLKRLSIVCMSTGSLLAVSSASEASQPAVLYIPDNDVMLVPLHECPIFQSTAWDYNSGLGCGGVSDETLVQPYDEDLDALMQGLRTALAPYDVHVTHERPPPYVPYHMLLVAGAPDDADAGDDCVATILNCGAERRNRIAFTRQSGACANVVPLHAALHAFGRMSGLEAVETVDETVDDPMVDPRDGSSAYSFQDRCTPIADPRRNDNARTEGECGSTHHVDCEPGQQNGHRELLHVYGARRSDWDPPEISSILPEQDSILPWPEVSVSIGAHIVDADPFIPLRWSFHAPEEEDWSTFITRCTNHTCYQSISLDALPQLIMLRPAESWTIVLEASDLHGNVAEPVLRSVSFGGPPPLADEEDDTEGTSTGGEPSSTSETTTGMAETTSEEKAGCGCTHSREPPNLLVLFSLLSLRQRGHGEASVEKQLT